MTKQDNHLANLSTKIKSKCCLNADEAKVTSLCYYRRVCISLLVIYSKITFHKTKNQCNSTV